MSRHPGIGSFVDVLDKDIVKPLQTLLIVVFVETGEDNLDVFIKKKVHSWSPELTL